MLQQLPQASHSLKNLLEEEWNFTKEITPYIRGGEAQAGKLFWQVLFNYSSCGVNLYQVHIQVSTCSRFPRWAS